MRAVATRRKEEEKKVKGKEGASLLAPKVVGQGAPKRKVDGKDDCLSKKVTVTPRDKPPKKPSPKPSHGVGKGLMMSSGPVTQEPNRHLLTHKEYTVKVIKSIIKGTNVDPCAEQMTEELGASSLFDIAQVHFFLPFFLSFFIYCLIANSRPVCRCWSA